MVIGQRCPALPVGFKDACRRRFERRESEDILESRTRRVSTKKETKFSDVLRIENLIRKMHPYLNIG